MKRKILLDINSPTDNNSINNTFYFTPHNNTIDIYKETIIPITSSRINRGKNIHNQKEDNNNNKTNYLEIESNSKRNMKKKYLNNSNLMPKKYIKSLNYAFNKHINIINTQFDNYNKVIAKINKNNNLKINKNILKYNNSKTSKTSPRNGNSGKDKFLNSKNAKNLPVASNINNDINILNNKVLINEVNQRIITIQKCYRGYFVRNKLYNTFLYYTKFIRLFEILEKYYLKNIFLKIKYYISQQSLYNKNSINIYDENSNQNTNINEDSKNKKINYYICNIDNISINNNTDIVTIKNKNLQYNICSINNFNIIQIGEIKNNNINKIQNNNLADINYLIEEKKIYEVKIKDLTEVNNALKKKIYDYQKNEDTYINIKLENEKLNNIINDILKEKSQILNELNNIKKEYEKLIKEKNNLSVSEQKIIKQKIGIDTEKEINNKALNEGVDNINENINIIKPKIDEKKEREKYLKNLFRNKVFEMRDYLHKCFIKFYYNGVFLKMTGKLSHLNKEKETNEIKVLNFSFTSENENEKNNNNAEENKEINENTISSNNNIKIESQKEKEQKEKEEKEKKELKERLKKSRGLRKLMNKKAHERLELLRVNFYKFYRAGIIAQFRSKKKKKTTEVRGSKRLDISKRLLQNDDIDDKKFRLKSSQNLYAKDIKEKEELKKKTVRILERIIFKADRKNMIVKKKIFNKFYLKAKLETVKNILDKDKGKKKKKKKKKVKFAKDINMEETKIDENNKDEGDDVSKMNNN